jgi:hypothetical protein
VVYVFGNLAQLLVVLQYQYAFAFPIAHIAFAFPIVHIAFPLGYFALWRPVIGRRLGRLWLSQRSFAREFQLTPTFEERANLAEVETAITAQDELKEEDELTLLHLAVVYEHYDSVQRLLQTGEVQANKPSGSNGRTALFLATELGRLHAIVLLVEHSADVNAVAEDGQSPLIE